LDLVLLVSAWSADVPWAAVDVPALGVISVLLYIVGVLYFERGEGRLLNKYSVFVLLSGTALVWSVVLRPLEHPVLRCVFLDVGQGDAIALRTPSGRTMLVDTGPSMGESDSGARTIVPWLRRNGIDTLDVLVLTHPDDDHIGGAVSVMEACVVRNIYVACTWPVQPQAVAVRQRMREEGAAIHDARAGDVIALDPQVRIHVLSPPDSVACTASNEHSVVLHLRHGACSMLLTGDAEIDSERRMVARYGPLLKADVLKVGHHGSGTSSSEEFLQAVAPGQAVITVGRLNRFRHPKHSVLARLAAMNTRVHRTDTHGAIILESDGRMWRSIAW
jgi:competence protein ComEC